MSDEQEPHVTATKTPDGRNTEVNDAAWDVLQEAVSLAVGSAIRDGDLMGRRSLPFRRLRTSLEAVQRRADGESTGVKRNPT